MTASETTPPACLQCGQPVTPARPGGYGKRGPRREHGQTWRWYCSRRCSGLSAGARNVSNGILSRYLLVAAQARYDALNAKRQAHFQAEADVFRRYGVPRELAQNLLDRVFRMGVKSGRDRTMRRVAA